MFDLMVKFRERRIILETGQPNGGRKLTSRQ